MIDAFDARVRAKFANVLRTRDDMHGYQDEAVQFAKDNPFSALFLDLGLGKSISMLTLIVDLLSEFLYDKVLVIGPMRVATQTWPNEIGEWLHTAHLNYSVIQVSDDHPAVRQAAQQGRSEARLRGMSPGEATSAGNAAAMACKERLRIAATRNTASIHTISVDWIEWLVDYWGVNWPYRMVIVDESSLLKDYKTNRFKALAKVRNHPGLLERVHLLTATPAAETYEHLFSQIYLLDGGERFGKHITRFREEFFVKNTYTRKYKLRPNAEDAILAKIADISIVMKAKDHLKVEEAQIIRRPITLGDVEMTLYRTLEKEFVVTLPDGSEVEAETAAALSAKLLQMCIAEGTPVLTSDGWVPVQNVNTAHLLWDGFEWVSHGGVITQGVKPTIECFGVRMTEDHKVLTDLGWKEAKEILNGKSGNQFNRYTVRLPDSVVSTWHHDRCMQEGHLAMCLRLWKGSCARKSEPQIASSTQRPTLRLPSRQLTAGARDVGNKTFPNLAGDAQAMCEPHAQGLPELRGSGDRCLRPMVELVFSFLERHATRLRRHVDIGSSVQQRPVLAGELPLGDWAATIKQQAKQRGDRHADGADDSHPSCEGLRSGSGDIVCQDLSLRLGCTDSVVKTPTFDIKDAGRRNQFVVRGFDGQALIVHNCSGMLYETYMDQDLETEDFKKVKKVHHIHDQKIDELRAIVEAAPGEPILVAYHWKSSLSRLQKAFPKAVAMDREGKCVKAWNQGKIPMLLMHPQSGGHGLNLQHGGHILVIFDLFYSLELFLQLVGRLARQGQKKPVLVYMLTALGTLDEAVAAALKAKEDAQDNLFRVLRKLIKKYRQARQAALDDEL